MTYTYNLHLGTKQPVFVYQSYTWLRKRLTRLAREGALKSCTLLVSDGKKTKHLTVTFNRNGGSYGWECTDGIPRTSVRYRQMSFQWGK